MDIKNKNTMIIVLAASILLVISGILCIITFNKTKESTDYITNAEKKYPSIINLVNNQKTINERLKKETLIKQHTFENPYVEVNPYGISPLSGIIIFYTNTEQEIKVYINDKYVTTTSMSKKHSIPVYGLLEDYDNVVRLENGTEVSEVTLKTEKSNIEYPLEVVEKSKNINNEEIYFTVASYKTYLTGWDTDGNLRFYLTVDNRMDVEWLDNGHFIIGTTQDQTREQFVGFVEMDYLGKVYNYYTLENGFSFESQILTNGNIMTAGGESAIYFTHQMITEIDPVDGTTVSSLDIYDVIKKIDPDFNDKYLGPSAIRNGFYYNEKTNELLVSFRDISTIFSFNYKTQKLNWIFTNPNNELFQNAVWKNYFVQLESGRYPYGQHTPQITKDGYIAFFNNDYDRYGIYVNGKSDEVQNFKNNYSAAEIYEIKDKKANIIYSYDENKSLYSIKYGLFRVSNDNHKLINFGYILKNDYRNTLGNSIKATENGIDSIYAMIVDLDENDNVIFKATCEEGKYRVFKHKLYNKETINTDVSMLNIYNTIPEDELEVVDYTEFTKRNTIDWINSLNITKNTFTTDYEIQDDDEITLYFLSDKGKVFGLNYKEKDSKTNKRVFDLELAEGNYAIFIEINGVLYNTKSLIEFD